MISRFNVKKSIKINSTGVKLIIDEGLNKQIDKKYRKEVTRLMPPAICEVLQKSTRPLYLVYMGEISLKWRRKRWRKLYQI